MPTKLPVLLIAAWAIMLSISLAQAQSLHDYAVQCAKETEIPVPAFYCDDPLSTLVPMTNAVDSNNNPIAFGPNSDFVALYAKVKEGSGGRCDRPDRLNKECDPGSRFQVINQTPDAYVVAHCRKKGNAGNTWGDIAVIQHNTKNGATCFYQEGPADGLNNRVEAPVDQGPNQWHQPSETHAEGCVNCHDNGPIIRSPYLSQITTGLNKLPGANDYGFNASGAPYYFVGPDFADWHVYSVQIKGNTCNGCHRMGANNMALSGTSLDFGLRATAQMPEAAKNPHSPTSPIWMTPGQITFSTKNAAAAQAISDCAAHRLDSPPPNSDTCRITQYDGNPSRGWHNFELAGVNSAFGSARIAAVARIPSSMETFWIAPNGAVRDAFWYDGAPWKQFELAGPNSAAPGSGIAVVSRIPNSMEVFWIGADGSVQDAFWYDGQPWKRFTLAPAGSAAKTSAIAAVSRLPNTMEIFWTAPNGAVQDAFWYDGAPWKQFELSPGGSASVTGSIKAVARRPNTMEVWWIGANGSIQDAYWYEGAVWKQFQLAPVGSSSVTGGIAAVSRVPGSMETWWIGANGSVHDNFFYE